MKYNILIIFVFFMLLPIFGKNLDFNFKLIIQEKTEYFCINTRPKVKIKFKGKYPGTIYYVIGEFNEEGELIASYSKQPISQNTFNDGELIYTGKTINYSTIFKIIEIRVSNSDGIHILNINKYTSGQAFFLKPYITSFEEEDYPPVCGLSLDFSKVKIKNAETIKWSCTGGTFDDDTKQNPVLTVKEPGKYNVSVTMTRGVICTNQISREITFLGSSPSGTIVDATETFCSSLPYQNIHIKMEFGGTPPFKFKIGNSNNDEFTPVSTSSKKFNKLVSVTKPTEFKLLWVTDNNNCKSSPADLKGSVIVKDIKPNPKLMDDFSVCGKVAKLKVLGDINNQKVGTWTGAGDIKNPDKTITSVEADKYGTIPFTYTQNVKGCKGAATVNVSFHEKPSPVDAGKDIVVYKQNEIKLDASQPKISNGYWSVTEGDASLANPNNPKTRLLDLKPGEKYKLKWTVEGTKYCPEQFKEINVSVSDVFAPTGFSPNGDGKNDYFKISGADFMKNNKLIVFDKYGKVVVKFTNYKNTWDGTYPDGTEVPEDTYYYVFEGDDLDKPIKNYLIIKR